MDKHKIAGSISKLKSIIQMLSQLAVFKQNLPNLLELCGKVHENPLIDAVILADVFLLEGILHDNCSLIWRLCDYLG